jgi:hypothetical protein
LDPPKSPLKRGTLSPVPPFLRGVRGDHRVVFITQNTFSNILLEFAQYRSQTLGYGGLVGLHSLPGAEAFYRQAGFIECGADPEKENLIYFEFYRREPPSEDNWQDQVDWESLDSDNGVDEDDL